MDWTAIFDALLNAFGPVGAIVIVGLVAAWWFERQERKGIAASERQMAVDMTAAIQSQAASNARVSDALKDLSFEVRS